jgi:hypothetical protein
MQLGMIERGPKGACTATVQTRGKSGCAIFALQASARRRAAAASGVSPNGSGAVLSILHAGKWPWPVGRLRAAQRKMRYRLHKTRTGDGAALAGGGACPVMGDDDALVANLVPTLVTGPSLADRAQRTPRRRVDAQRGAKD